LNPHVVRFSADSTYRNRDTLIELIFNDVCDEIRLFGSPREITPAYSERGDGPESNLPLLAACCRYNIAGLVQGYILFDGLVMTAARQPRAREVAELLDQAQMSGKVSFGVQSADFTSSLDPDAALKALLSIPTVQLTKDTRAQYFALLSNVSEHQIFG
jgi:hypothetical protein